MTIQDGTTRETTGPANDDPPPVHDHRGVKLIQGLAVALAVLFVLAAVRTAGADANIDPEPVSAPLAAIDAG